MRRKGSHAANLGAPVAEAGRCAPNWSAMFTARSFQELRRPICRRLLHAMHSPIVSRRDHGASAAIRAEIGLGMRQKDRRVNLAARTPYRAGAAARRPGRTARGYRRGEALRSSRFKRPVMRRAQPPQGRQGLVDATRPDARTGQPAHACRGHRARGTGTRSSSPGRPGSRPSSRGPTAPA